jgi:DNA-3-methyladenine glycosylase II
MRDLIQRVGPVEIQLERDPFRALVSSIISQQISGSAARSILRRLAEYLGEEGFVPSGLARLTREELREAGVSPQKAGYLLDLAGKVSTGQLSLTHLGRVSDEAIVDRLVQVKGIGTWTAQMFLIFSLGRLNVFPSQDLGVRAALRNLYGLKELPDRETGERIAESWRPYATVGSWYCWRSLEMIKKNRD